MRSVMLIGAGFLMATSVMFASGLVNQDEPKKLDDLQREVDRLTQDPPTEMDMESMMAEYMKFATPGKQHEQLMRMRGSWDVVSKFRMGADQDWMEDAATARFRPMIGNRFIAQTVRSGPSEMMPEGFEGYGLIGYDTARGVYQQTWVDDHGTMMMVMEGPGNEAGTEFTLKGVFDDPVLKMKKTLKWVYRIESDDKIVFEMHEPVMGTDEMYLMGVITYTRSATQERGDRIR